MQLLKDERLRIELETIISRNSYTLATIRRTPPRNIYVLSQFFGEAALKTLSR